MRIGARLWLYGNVVFMRWWYTLSQLLTRKRVTLPTFSSFREIIEHLGYGHRYKPDPIKGKLDILNHPTKVEQRIRGTGDIEDCDGHGAYWCQALLRSHLCSVAYFATLYMADKDTGKQSGHAFCVFRDGVARYWADYREPSVYVNDWDWARDCAATFNAVPLAATLTHVEIAKSGRVKFGRMQTHTFPEP